MYIKKLQNRWLSVKQRTRARCSCCRHRSDSRARSPSILIDLNNAGDDAASGVDACGVDGDEALKERLSNFRLFKKKGVDYNCMLRRVGELVDALLGDELEHPYRKNFAHNSTERGGAPFFRSADSNILNIVLTFKR